jgi:ATP-dependent Zn protease
MPTEPEITPRQIAYHEAGHAVVHTMLGLGTEMVTVVPHTDEDGDIILGLHRQEEENVHLLVCAFDVGYTEAEELADKMIIQALSGRQAEMKYCRHANLPEPPIEYADHDYDIINELAFRCAPTPPTGEMIDARAYIAPLEEKAAQLLDEHWHLVERVAAVLHEEKTISGDRLLEILGKDRKELTAFDAIREEIEFENELERQFRERNG